MEWYANLLRGLIIVHMNDLKDSSQQCNNITFQCYPTPFCDSLSFFFSNKPPPQPPKKILFILWENSTFPILKSQYYNLDSLETTVIFGEAQLHICDLEGSKPKKKRLNLTWVG